MAGKSYLLTNDTKLPALTLYFPALPDGEDKFK